MHQRDKGINMKCPNCGKQRKMTICGDCCSGCQTAHDSELRELNNALNETIHEMQTLLNVQETDTEAYQIVKNHRDELKEENIILRQQLKKLTATNHHWEKMLSDRQDEVNRLMGGWCKEQDESNKFRNALSLIANIDETDLTGLLSKLQFAVKEARKALEDK